MKKLFLLTTTLLLSALSFAVYVNDKCCIYSLNVGEQTACVVNFCSEASVVTIPASFMYKGDRYVVTGLSNYNFKDTQFIQYGSSIFDSYSYETTNNDKYGYLDYEKYRACIVELNLPTTLKHINSDALGGMSRLKTLRVPSNVKDFSTSCFDDNMRLESVTFEGLPHVAHEYYVGVWPRGSWKKLYLDESNNPLAVLDSLQLYKKFKEECPRLKTVEFIPLKEYILYKNKLDKTYQVYSQQLRDTLNKYTQILMSHPYYVEDNHFKGITLTAPHLQAEGVRENYALQISALKKDYNRQLTLCREKCSALMSDMENICKKKSPELYAEKYCALHPDFSAQIDTMLKDYKCEYTKQRLALAVLNNYQLSEKCQDKLWKHYSYLYKDKETFLAAYEKSSDIKHVIGKREDIYQSFKNQIRYTTVAIKGLYDLDESKHPNLTKKFRFNYDEMRRYGIPVSKLIIEQNPKALKEFEKNGQYFDSPDEFFAAYITSNYSKTLKEKKKAKK